MTVARQAWQGLESLIPANRRPRDVRVSPPITFTPGQDVMHTHRGVTFGIKVTDTGEVNMVTLFERSGETWVVGVMLGDLGWIDECKASFGGDVKAWFKARALPKLQSWLAQRFPATTAPPPPPKGPSEELDQYLIGFLRLNPQPDGRLTAHLD